MMNDKLTNLLVRTASGAVLAVVILGGVLWSRWSFAALLALLTVGGLLEFYALARKCGATPQPVIGTVASLALLAVPVFITADYVGLNGLLALFLLVPTTFVCALWSRSAHPIADIGATMLGVVYVALPFACAAIFCHHDDKWPVIGYILIIWANDVCAYLVGLLLGRHPLFPRLSPKKSWEGFFGGLAGAVCVGLLMARLLHAPLGMWAGLALVAAVAGVAGDLVESMFKRAAGVKDSGNLIPGHGGVLDRFDAMLLSIPFVCAYLLFFV